MWRPFPRAAATFFFAMTCAACGATTPIAPSAVAPPVAAQGKTQASAAVALTGGTLQLYALDPGSAHLQADGFDVTSTATGGSWPQTVAPGTAVTFGGNVTLSDWGNVTVNGAALHGDASGPGAGRVWISGAIGISATPLMAPLAPAFSGQLQTAVTLTGSISGFANATPGQAALFTTNVSGAGVLSGTYRVVNASSGPMFLNNCCVVLQVAAR